MIEELKQLARQTQYDYLPNGASIGALLLSIAEELEERLTTC